MNRNDNVIPRLSRGAGDGVNKMCAMQLVSWQNGDVQITDYPSCSARPLAALVQMVNDTLAGPDGFLSPENAVIALDLGWQTVGTADVPASVMHLWQAEMLESPIWGVVRFANAETKPIIAQVADIHRRMAAGEQGLESAAWSAAKSAKSAAKSAAWSAESAESAKSAAYSAAYSADSAAWSAKSAESAKSAAYSAAWSAESANVYVDFTRTAIAAWRRIAELDTSPVDYEATDRALASIAAKS